MASDHYEQRTSIVTAAQRDKLREMLAASYPELARSWSEPLSPTGEEPATHYMAVGWMPKEAVALLPDATIRKKNKVEAEPIEELPVDGRMRGLAGLEGAGDEKPPEDEKPPVDDTSEKVVDVVETIDADREKVTRPALTKTLTAKINASKAEAAEAVAEVEIAAVCAEIEQTDEDWPDMLARTGLQVIQSSDPAPPEK